MIIEEIQVNEVSLAANPKNKKRFICIKYNKVGILMYNFLKYYNLPVTIIATKADKVGGSKKQKNLKKNAKAILLFAS